MSVFVSSVTGGSGCVEGLILHLVNAFVALFGSFRVW